MLVSDGQDPEITTAIAAYRILDGFQSALKATGGGGRMMTIINCAGTATFTICPAATTTVTSAAAGATSFSIATRRRLTLPICLLQPYYRKNDDHDDSFQTRPCMISSLQFQSLVEANYFFHSLKSASRLCTEQQQLGRWSAVENKGSGMSTCSSSICNANRKRQLANAAADEMLAPCARSSHPSLAVKKGREESVKLVTKDEGVAEEKEIGEPWKSILQTEVTAAAATATNTATYASPASSSADLRPPTLDLEMEPFGFSFDADADNTVNGNKARGAAGASPPAGAAVTTPRELVQNLVATTRTTNQEWGLSPIACNDAHLDDPLIASPTRKFLASLFNSDVCMTPFDAL